MKDPKFEEALHASGITRKGRKLAAVIWAAADPVFAAAPAGANPFDIVDMVTRMFRCKAADLDIARRKSR